MKALFAFLAGSAIFSLASAGEGPPTLPLGAAAPDFDLPGVDGRHWKLTDFKTSKVLVVVFTCNHCPTAQYYEERIKQFSRDYREKGVALVAISPNDPRSVRLDELGWSDLGDSFEDMKLRARDRQFNFPYLYDGDAETVSRAYGPVATPHVFVFDADRKLRYQGRIDDSERPMGVRVHYLREVVDALLSEKVPPFTSTKPVGCSVKWAGKAEAVKEYMERLAAEPVELLPADEAELKALRQGNPAKFRLVNFWATWCPPCVVEFPELVTVHRMYRHRDFELVTVSVNRPDERAQVLDFLKKQQASSRNLLFASTDRDRLMDAFDSTWRGQVPYTVLISPEGEVLYRQAEALDALALKRPSTHGSPGRASCAPVPQCVRYAFAIVPYDRPEQ